MSFVSAVADLSTRISQEIKALRSKTEIKPYLVSQLPVLLDSDKGKLAYCSDTVTSYGLGSIVVWKGISLGWVTTGANLPPLATQTEFLNYVKNSLTEYTECFVAAASCFGSMNGLAILSGTVNGPTGVSLVGRPGLVRFKSSTTANSGYNIAISGNNYQIKGGERFLAAWITPSVFSTITTRMGYQDSFTVSDLVDGVYFETNPNNNNVVARAASNNIRTTGNGVFALNVNTYYWFSIVINDAATLATFKIFSEAGDLLFTDSISTNIPNTAGRETGIGITSTSSGIVSIDLLHLDFMGFRINNTRPLLQI